jgi:hypothetical protein
VPHFFIRTSSASGGDKFLGPYEPFEVLRLAESLRAQGLGFTITDEEGKAADEQAIARGDFLSPRDEELANMMETEFPAIWKTALEIAHGHRNVALSTIVRLVRRHIEVAAIERERRLTGGQGEREEEK